MDPITTSGHPGGAATKRKTKTKSKPRPRAPSRAVTIHKAAPPAAPAPSNLLQVIAGAVADPRCDVAKMQALLDMQEQIEEREAKKAFTRAFTALQSELPVINRDGKIDHSSDGGDTTRSGRRALKTTYATYPNLMKVVKPLLKKHGFTLSTTVKSNDKGLIVVTSQLAHVEGHARETEFTLGADTTGGKNNQQGWGSSQQYGMRYNAIALLNISTEAKQDADNDGFAPTDLITKKQADELIKLLDAAGASKEKFCAVFGVDGIAMLPVKDFDAAKSRIAAFKKKVDEASDFPGDRK